VLVLLAFISLPAIVAAIGMMCLPSLSEVLRICLERASAWRSPEEFRNRKLSKIAQKMSGDRYDVPASPRISLPLSRDQSRQVDPSSEITPPKSTFHGIIIPGRSPISMSVLACWHQGRPRFAGASCPMHGSVHKQEHIAVAGPIVLAQTQFWRPVQSYAAD
jgi:hypothetical protein